MPRTSFGRTYIDPRQTSNFLDSCAFDPKYSPEDAASRLIRKLGNSGVVNLLLTHSNQKEIEHPNTPEDVKREARAMIYTLETTLTQEELKRKTEILAILTGNGRPEKYKADAAHVFEAGKYVGYFITTDQRILANQEELSRVCAATIFKPSKWLEVFNEAGA